METIDFTEAISLEMPAGPSAPGDEPARREHVIGKLPAMPDSWVAEHGVFEPILGGA